MRHLRAGNISIRSYRLFEEFVLFRRYFFSSQSAALNEPLIKMNQFCTILVDNNRLRKILENFY